MEMKGNKLKKSVHCSTKMMDCIVTVLSEYITFLSRTWLEHNFNLIDLWGAIFLKYSIEGYENSYDIFYLSLESLNLICDSMSF